MVSRDTLHIDPPFRERLVSAGLDGVARVLACRGDHLAAWSRTSDAIRVDLPENGGAIYVKRYHYPTLKRRWRGFFRGTFFGMSRARSEFRNLRQMRQLGIHAVRPIAWGERRTLHLVRSCFLITEAVPDALSLAAFVQTFHHRPMVRSRVRARHEVLRSLAAEVRRMHEAGFVHQDLFWRNVLVRPLSGERFEFYVLDASLGRRIRVKAWRREKIVHDLAALSVLAPDFCTKSDQLRFIREYLGATTLGEEDRAWLTDVQKHWALYRRTERQRLERGRVFDRPPLSGSAPTPTAAPPAAT